MTSPQKIGASKITYPTVRITERTYARPALDIRRCAIKGHPSFDVRNGCPFCPRGEEVLRAQLAASEKNAAAWKEAWYDQRRCTGAYGAALLPASYRTTA